MSRFSTAVCEVLHTMSLDGGPDEEYGDVTEAPGFWMGLMTSIDRGEFEQAASRQLTVKEFRNYAGGDRKLHVILFEDGDGFVDCEFFDTKSAAQKEFKKIATKAEKEIEEANA